jgi:hypothetical protein
MAWFVFTLAVIAATSLWWGPWLADDGCEQRVRRAASAMERIETEMLRQMHAIQRESSRTKRRQKRKPR